MGTEKSSLMANPVLLGSATAHAVKYQCANGKTMDFPSLLSLSSRRLAEIQPFRAVPIFLTISGGWEKMPAITRSQLCHRKRFYLS